MKFKRLTVGDDSFEVTARRGELVPVVIAGIAEPTVFRYSPVGGEESFLRGGPTTYSNERWPE